MKKHKSETSKRKAIDSGYETNKRSLSFNPKWSNRYAWIEYDARGWICLPANEVGVESELMFMYAVLNSESMIVPSPPGPVVEAQARPIVWTGICVCTIFGGPTIALVVDVQAAPLGVLRPVEMKHFLSLIEIMKAYSMLRIPDIHSWAI